MPVRSEEMSGSLGLSNASQSSEVLRASDRSRSGI